MASVSAPAIDQSQDPANVRLAAYGCGLSALAVLALTAIHHAYGAALYDAAFRKHVAIVAAPVAVVIALALAASERWRSRPTGRAARLVAAFAIAVFPVLAIGLFEGFYNHLVKNLVFMAGYYEQLAPSLFPPPTYERPDNWLFEITGVLQFPLGVLAAVMLRRWMRMSRRLPVPDQCPAGRRQCQAD